MMNTSLRVFQINASGKIVLVSRQSSLEPGTTNSLVPTQTQDGNCSQEVSMQVPIIPHGSQVSHTLNNAPMILRKGSKMVASRSCLAGALPRRRWSPKFCPNHLRCPGTTFSGNRGGDLHLTYIPLCRLPNPPT